MRKQDSQQDNHKPVWAAGLACAVFVIAVWLVTLPSSWGDRRFEAVSALFAGLAFAGLIVAILLQRKELMLQRLELEQTRDELKGQKEQLELQNTTMKKQSFENTFFQLLHLHNEIVRAIDLAVPGEGHRQGRDSFLPLYLMLRQQIWNPPRHAADQPVRERLSGVYQLFFLNYQAHIGHYFRNLYHVVRFVDQSELLRDDEKRFYTTLVRAQLSSYETVLLFYNCLADGLGAGAFERLVHRYALLKNMPTVLLFDPEHESLFPPEAYGKAGTEQAAPP